jgi:hypothetical protein
MSSQNQFCYVVYLLVDPTKLGYFKYNEFEFDHEPMYVGMGGDYRPYRHFSPGYLDQADNINVDKSLYKRIKHLISLGYKDSITYLFAYFVDRDIALYYEGKLIASIGTRKDGGILYNKRYNNIVKSEFRDEAHATEVMTDMHYNQLLSTRDIADKFGCSQCYVINKIGKILSRADLAARRYGYSGEEEIVSKLIDLIKQGITGPYILANKLGISVCYIKWRLPELMKFAKST